MGLSRDQALSMYGTEAATGWGEAEAAANFKPRAAGSSPSISTPAIPDYAAIARQQAADRTKLLAENEAKQNAFLGKYSDFLRGQEGMGAMSQRIGQEIGLPNIKSTAEGLTQTYSQMPYTTTAATRGFDVNENQRQRIIAQKQAELAPALQSAQSAYSSALGTLGTMMGYEQADQAKALKPLELEASMMNDRIAQEISGFDTSSKNELDAIMTQWQQGYQVTKDQMDRATALAEREQNYNLQKMQLDEQARYKTISGGGSIYDTRTGKIIETAPKVSVSGGGNKGGNLGSYYTEWEITS